MVIKKLNIKLEHILIFFIAALTITLELLLTRVLNLKAWNHVVYLVIPFAILGYGIGANIYLIFKNKFDKLDLKKLLGWSCLAISLLTVFTFSVISQLPINVEDLVKALYSPTSTSMLLVAYTVYMLPFILIGFVIVLLFSRCEKECHKLYFFDLLGAGFGAITFFLLITILGMVHSIYVLSLTAACFSAVILWPKFRGFFLLGTILLAALGFNVIPQKIKYTIDARKDWEWIPGFFDTSAYKHLISKWHPLGRTDAFQMKSETAREKLYKAAEGTFQLNVDPKPEFTYLSTNYLGGTPVFQFSEDNLHKIRAKIKPFSQTMEAPYLLLDKPKVMIIGVGGGRDIFMAKTHGASQVIGAEINPGIVDIMSPGGGLHEYSGQIYSKGNTKVEKLDGRHLVKKLPPDSTDLIVLNGVDTFSGLSSGAYAYAESYLYTINAFKDYYRILSQDGILNFNRWLFGDLPRETLRLHAIALQGMKELGVKNPEKHILIARANKAWSIILIKKSPFNSEQIEKVRHYMESLGQCIIYPADDKLKLDQNDPMLNFHKYAKSFKQGKERDFLKAYPYDISIVTDDAPFFYKYYKVGKLLGGFVCHHTGPIIFYTQGMALLQAGIFMIVLIYFPLAFFKTKNITILSYKTIRSFVCYFASLGIGYMLIEIPLMQKFVLLLGSPIHSITVVLSALLIATGIGSLSMPKFLSHFTSKNKLLVVLTVLLTTYVMFLIFVGIDMSNYFMASPFGLRAIVVSLVVFPVGYLLGFYFPLGLEHFGEQSNECIAWAWGINGSASVMGSILSIIIAQFMGFNLILGAGTVLYFLAVLNFILINREATRNQVVS